MTIEYEVLDLKNEQLFFQVKDLIDNDLSEPYSIYVYRYFLNQWPELCFIAYDTENPTEKHGSREPVGCIISKCEPHRGGARLRGYIGMLVIQEKYRGKGIAKELIRKTLDALENEMHCDEIMLETECSNEAALHLYEGFGFIRMKRLFRYYLNKGDAFKLILPLTKKSGVRSLFLTNDQGEPLDVI
ncbi:N-alpha-acetyltransferase mak3 [Hanseniaspora osmophila]|uniref:N-alpha-acetyltransferase 30 n=1 Tax=Hanseniaspora osmophila TaxID=56408 RepID=A0A1E5RE08_9ASCO|nr:N-alpha-acetyltransferase 30 [Hanseniaspora osmophila]